MRWLQIHTGTDSAGDRPKWWERAVHAVLTRILPAANPDLEHLIGRCSTWWLEVDDDGHPLREIGFDADGVPVMLGPAGKNYGFLLDASDDWRSEPDGPPEVARDFDATWQALYPRFAHLDWAERR